MLVSMTLMQDHSGSSNTKNPALLWITSTTKQAISIKVVAMVGFFFFFFFLTWPWLCKRLYSLPTCFHLFSPFSYKLYLLLIWAFSPCLDTHAHTHTHIHARTHAHTHTNQHTMLCGWQFYSKLLTSTVHRPSSMSITPMQRIKCRPPSR